MSILLRPVHFVASDGPRRGKCRVAEVFDHGIETVDLYIEAEVDDFGWSIDAVDMLGQTTPQNVKFDAEGKEGTFHFANDCPIERRERERQEGLKRWLERHERRKTSRKVDG